MRKCKFTTEIFKSTVHIFTDCTFQEFLKEIPSKVLGDIETTDASGYTIGRNYVFYVYYNNKSLDNLVHELLHVVQDNLQYRDVDDNETEAYFYDYIFSKAMKGLKIKVIYE